MQDAHGRTIEYLRISVTDRCNLRCRYCMPAEGVPSIPHGEILRYDEIERLARVMAGLGVSRVRLTGGEPLARRGVERLAAGLRRIPGIRFLGLTTNGALLGEKAAALCEAGVDGVNVSLDTVDRDRYAYLTRTDGLEAALSGLHAALALPFRSVKVNSVLSPDSVAADWLGVAALAKGLPVDVRLIEWMPMAGEAPRPAVWMDAALEAVSQKFGALRRLEKETQGGPARYYAIDGFTGRVGAIPAMSRNFCGACNRVRLTSTGDLKTCLFYDSGVALKPLLRGGATDGEITAAILRAVEQKPERHYGERQGGGGAIARPCGMSGVGG